jgi:OOP family OmpA-OmpF porin
MEMHPMFNSRSLQRAAMATTLAAGLAGGAQAADDEGWYGGLDLGRSHLGLSGADIDNRNAGFGVTSSSTLETRDTAWSLVGGYRFNRNVALEGAYVDLGSHKLSGTTSAPAAGSLDGRYKVHGYRIAAVGIVPLSSGFSLYGKAGLMFARTDLELSASSVALSGAGQSRTVGTLGLGMSYDFTRNVFARAEWNRYARVGDDGTGRSSIDAYTVGVGYRF